MIFVGQSTDSFTLIAKPRCCDRKINCCVKSVRIRSDSGPYSVRIRENTDQNNSEYGHFLRSEYVPPYL